jgi:thymidylate synthase (FAD)
VKVELIAETKFLKLNEYSDTDLEKLTYYAAKICHNKHDGSENSELEKVSRFIKKFVIDMDHSSLLEHHSFTFLVEGISRCCSHQLVRHRIASYHQLSMRYCKQENDPIVPQSIFDNPELGLKYLDCVNDLYDVYNEMIDKGIPLEDARYLLPGAAKTSILVTWNARTLLHVLKLRLWKDGAQWEIKEMLQKMLDIVKTRSDVIFNEPKS